MVKASGVLLREHQSLRDALEVLEEICFLLRAEQEILVEDIQALVDFLMRYSRDLHQQKEEKLLFPALEKAGVSRSEGHFAMLEASHEIGAVYLRQLVAAGNRAYLNRDEFIEAAESYLRLQLEHIDAEEAGLFRLADERLSPPAQLDLIAEFERYDREVVGADKIEEAGHVLAYFHMKYMENMD